MFGGRKLAHSNSSSFFVPKAFLNRSLNLAKHLGNLIKVSGLGFLKFCAVRLSVPDFFTDKDRSNGLVNFHELTTQVFRHKNAVQGEVVVQFSLRALCIFKLEPEHLFSIVLSFIRGLP